MLQVTFLDASFAAVFDMLFRRNRGACESERPIAAKLSFLDFAFFQLLRYSSNDKNESEDFVSGHLCVLCIDL